MPLPAPGAKAPFARRPQDESVSTPEWTTRFLAHSAQRTRRNSLPLMWTLMAGAVLPIGLLAQAEVAGQPDSQATAPTVSAVPTTATSVSTSSAASSTAASGAETDKSLVNPATVTSPAGAASLTAPAPDASATNTTLPTAPAVSSSAPAAPITPDFSGNPLPALPSVAGHSLLIRAVVSGKHREGRVLAPLQGISVGDALKGMSIKLGPLDRVSPLAQTNAFNGMTVRVARVSAPLQKRRELIFGETRYRPTSEFAPGQRQVVQHGRAGAWEITERVWMLDCKQKRRDYVSRRVVLKPRDTIVALGSRSAYVPGRVPYHNRYARAYALTARGGSPRARMAASGTATVPAAGTFRALRSIELVATGYSPDPRENGGYTRTATGLPIGYGAAAVDPRVIPLGTKLYVEGYGYAFACDTGGAIKGRRIDLAYNSYYEANTKGHKKVKAWILGN